MSEPRNNGGDMVHERPAWIVPAIVGGGVLVLSAVLMAYYLWPVIAEQLGLQVAPSAIAEPVRLEIGGQAFDVPRNYLRSASAGPGGDEAMLHAVLPDLAPYSSKTAKAFDDRSGASPLITMTLSPIGTFLPDDRRFDLVYSRHLAEGNPVESVHGLQRFTFELDSGFADQDLFLGTDGDGRPLLLLCYRGGPGLPPASCTRTLELALNANGDRAAAIVTYRFRRVYLADWQVIDAGVTGLVEGFLVEGQ